MRWNILKEPLGLNLKAILIGWLVYIIGRKYLGALVINITEIFVSEMSYGQKLAHLVGASGARAACQVMSGSFVALGAYLTALIAGRVELRNAVAMGCLSLVSGLFIAFPCNSIQDSSRIAFACLMLLCALFGGYLRVLIQRQQPPRELITKEGEFWSRLSYPNSIPLICGALGFSMGASFFLGVLMLADLFMERQSSTAVLGLGFIPMLALQPAFIGFFIGCLLWPVLRCIHAPRPISEKLYRVLLRLFVVSGLLCGVIGIIVGINYPNKATLLDMIL